MHDGTQVAENFYDDSGKLVAVQDANGNLTQFVHNLSNDMEVVIDRLGNTNTYVYDPRGNVILQTNALGQWTTMAYDLNNNKTNEVAFLNGASYATNSYLYDTNNLLLASTDPLNHATQYQYDGNGNLTITTDANNNRSTNYYDSVSDLVATSDAMGHITSNSYNSGMMTGSQDPINTLTTNYYDPSSGYLLGSAQTTASGTILSSNTFTYDANGNRLTSTVWRQAGGWTNATTICVYDAMNRVIQTINPDGGTNTIAYNVIGKQSATIDPLGHETDYAYVLRTFLPS